MAFKMDPNDLRGIEVWYREYREWVKKGRPEKYTKEEKDALYKKYKVGPYSESKDKVYRYNEIVKEIQQRNIDGYKLKVYTWVKRNHPHKAHLSWEELVEQGVHTQMYTGKKKEEHLEEELEDIDFM
jgi:hypothetical protein